MFAIPRLARDDRSNGVVCGGNERSEGSQVASKIKLEYNKIVSGYETEK